MNKIWVLQNIQPENLGIAGQVFQGCGLEPTYIHTFADEEVPRYMDEATGLVVLGGPMGVYEHDRYPFIDAAMRLIDQALKEDKPVLGICLGSQLLATALGARVARGPQKEIGWYPIELKPAASEDPLMGGLNHLLWAFTGTATSSICPRALLRWPLLPLTTYQAFSYGRAAYGVLFHMEVTTQIIADMVRAFADEVREEGLDGEQIKGRRSPALTRPSTPTDGLSFRTGPLSAWRRFPSSSSARPNR